MERCVSASDGAPGNTFSAHRQAATATQRPVGHSQWPPQALPVSGRPTRRYAGAPSRRRPTCLALVLSRREPPRPGPAVQVRLAIAHIPAEAAKHRALARAAVALEGARRNPEAISRLTRGEKHRCLSHSIPLLRGAPDDPGRLTNPPSQRKTHRRGRDEFAPPENVPPFARTRCH